MFCGGVLAGGSLAEGAVTIWTSLPAIASLRNAICTSVSFGGGGGALRGRPIGCGGAGICGGGCAGKPGGGPFGLPQPGGGLGSRNRVTPVAEPAGGAGWYGKSVGLNLLR